MTKMVMPKNNRRQLFWWEVRQLENQGCVIGQDANVTITDRTVLSAIRNVEMYGNVELDEINPATAPGVGIREAVLVDVTVGANPRIRCVRTALKNLRIGNNVSISDVGLIDMEPEAACGVGVEVSVLDETGSRPVKIYPGMSAQIAHLMARMPRWSEDNLFPLLDEKFESIVYGLDIEDNAIIRGIDFMRNVHIGEDVIIEGARRLVNGSVINNAGSSRGLAYVGSGVDAENFVVEDGRLDGGAYVRNCYVGQGAVLDKGFTAHDSLFFANCSLENGEACAVFAGPYTVSMHKATLLIGAMTSFMNAGSATNQSNHMYKLGPVHWGVMERGVKTSSGSYLMWGGKIGAFSLVMGSHKNHPDSSDFPFSYLFGDGTGATLVVPGMMLKSCGLLRDEKKWPTRDRRLKRKLPMHDRIRFDVLNPYTVGKMLDALPLIDELLSRPANDDRYVRFKNMKVRNSNLERARHLYRLAIMKYLSTRPEVDVHGEEDMQGPDEWIDISGQIIRTSDLRKAMEAESVAEMEQLLTEAHERYDADERRWINARFKSWDLSESEIRHGAEEFDKMVEEDRQKYLESLSAETSMLSESI